MRNRFPRLLVWLSIVASLGSFWPAAAQEQPRPEPRFPTLPADAPAGSGMMQPCLEELPGRVRCGRYRVWENRETRSGRTLDLAFVVADALDELVSECLNDPRCSAAYPNLDETAERVLDRVRSDPPEVTAEGDTLRLGPGELGYALRGLLYGRAGEVPALLAGAAEGDWQPLADYYLRRSGWVADEEGEAGMHFSVLCAEDISRVDDETIVRETAGTFLGDYLIGG